MSNSKLVKSRASTPSDDFVLHDSIGYLVNLVAREMQNALDKQLSPYGVTAAQWSVLIRCTHDGPQPPTALSRQLGIDLSAVTRLVDRLVAKDFVRRKPIPDDRRSFEIELTNTGAAVARKLPPHARAVLAQYLHGFSATEVRMLRTLLKRMIDNDALPES